MDEAFMPFRDILERLLSFEGEIANSDLGVSSHVYECEIEAPIELDVGRDESGGLQIGSTPPLYYVDTSVRPSFHRLTFTARASRWPHGD